MTAHELARKLLEGPDITVKMVMGYSPHVLVDVDSVTPNEEDNNHYYDASRYSSIEEHSSDEPYLLLE